ncbi:MAG: FAD-binding oxidoreductase [Pedobacter sp.]|nr:MAG: FAD-binding oxidoreductase [Pedobacter sp.]
MELNTSYWEQTSFYQSDVVVIGAGIVGLNTAIALKKLQPTLKITIVERSSLPAGASTKNAGFACFGSLSEMIEQEKNLGTDAWLNLVEKRWLGLQKLISIVGKPQLDYQAFGGYEIFKSEEKDFFESCVAQLSRFNTLLAPIFKQPVFNLAPDKITAFGLKDIPFLIENKLEAQLHPGKMMQSLMQIAGSLGIHYLTNCNVSHWEKTNTGFHIFSNLDILSTNKIAVCTNAFSSKWFPELDIKPGRGQVLITSEISNLKLKGTFHYDQGYYYFRNVGNRVLIGGGRHLDFKAEQTTKFGETPLVQAHLRSLLKNHIIPEVPFKIDKSWSGIMAFGETLNPLIIEYQENLFVALRCNGMGIAIGSQTGADLAQIIYQKT